MRPKQWDGEEALSGNVALRRRALFGSRAQRSIRRRVWATIRQILSRSSAGNFLDIVKASRSTPMFMELWVIVEAWPELS